MKVLLTKDHFGVQVWHSDIDVSYIKRINRSSGDKIWMNDKMYLFRKPRVMSYKFVKKYLPNLGRNMVIGSKEYMEMVFI